MIPARMFICTDTCTEITDLSAGSCSWTTAYMERLSSPVWRRPKSHFWACTGVAGVHGGRGAAENVLILLCGKDLSTSSPQIVYFSSARRLRSPSASFPQHISPLYVSPMLLDSGLGCFTVTQNVAGRYRTSEKTLVAWIFFCYVLKPNPSLEQLQSSRLFGNCFQGASWCGGWSWSASLPVPQYPRPSGWNQTWTNWLPSRLSVFSVRKSAKSGSF